MKNKKSSTEEFVEKAKAIHGDKYDYSKVVYVRSTDKVVVHCTKHGDWEITPSNHLNQR